MKCNACGVFNVDDSGADGSQGVDPAGVAGNSSGNRRRNNGLIQNPTAVNPDK